MFLGTRANKALVAGPLNLLRLVMCDLTLQCMWCLNEQPVPLVAATADIDDVYNERFLEMSELVIAETTKNIERLAQGKIEIINLIIPKPEIPKDIAANYQKVKVEWTEKLVAEKEQEKIQVRKETEELKAIADANRLKAVKKIDIEKQILLIRQHFFDLMLVK